MQLTRHVRTAIVCPIPMPNASLVVRARAATAFSWACVCVASACSTSDRFPNDAGVVDGGTMGGAPDAAIGGDAGAIVRGGPGAACEAPADCESGLFCDAEIDQSFLAADLPVGVDEIPASLFPGGSCTSIPAAPFDMMGGSCDPSMPPGAQGCGDDGVCVPAQVVRGTTVETWYACRRACDPADPAGCGRFGYTCDFLYGACAEGCQSDNECRLRIVDLNGDGQREFQYDVDSNAFCDPESFRCAHSGSGGTTGAPCERLDDCDADGVCLEALLGWAGFPWREGFCSKFGCDVAGRECSGAGATCAPLRTLGGGGVTPNACLIECTVGADAAADRLGRDGHGAGCRPGYRCHYNGGAGAKAGVCVGGNYNDIAKSNLGDPCDLASQCYSPYGLGQCLSLSVGVVAASSGVCTIMDCAAPGLPDDVCGKNAVCLGLNGDRSFCITECVDASGCAPGFACANDDDDESTPRVCFPACYADEDCRKGAETCEFPIDPSTNMPATVGQCSPV